MNLISKIGLSFVSILAIFVGIHGNDSHALAGGLEMPNASEAGFEIVVDPNCLNQPSQAPENQQNSSNSQLKCQRRIRTFDWKYWNQTVQPESSICRERNGNVICLDANATKRLRWLSTK